MSRIRSRGNERTEGALVRVFREQGIVGWRRHALLRVGNEAETRRVGDGETRRKGQKPDEGETEVAVVREEGGGYRVKSKVKEKQPVRASSRRLLHEEGVVKVRPDFVFRERKLAVFVDGCFWHGCAKCYVRPRQNRKFWDEKFARNTERDRKVNQALKAAGWKVLRIWEHELKRKVAGRLVRKLGRALQR